MCFYLTTERGNVRVDDMRKDTDCLFEIFQVPVNTFDTVAQF